MPTVPPKKFTKTYIEKEVLPQQALIPEGKVKYYWHPEVSGFGLKLTPNKAVYVVQRRVKTSTGEKNTRMVLGPYKTMTVESAEEEARKSFQIMNEGTDPIAEKKAQIDKARTLQETLDEYIDQYKDRLRPKTQAVYRSAVTRCFAEWLALPIVEIDEEMIAAKQIALSNHKGHRSNSDGAKAQANQAMRVLRTLFNHAKVAYKDAKKQPLITINPVQTLKPRRLWNKPVARKEIIDDDDLGIWYQAVMQLENATIRDYLLLCLFAGLRRSEAARLTWDNVRTWGKKPMLTIFAADTKTDSQHRLPLPPYLVALFERRRNDPEKDATYVFPGAKSGSHIVEPKGPIAKVIATTKKVDPNGEGVDFSLHVLRRTFSNIAGRLDIAYYKHKALMNHSVKNDVTGAHYMELTPEDLREPMQKIADHIERCFQLAGKADNADVEVGA